MHGSEKFVEAIADFVAGCCEGSKLIGKFTKCVDARRVHKINVAQGDFVLLPAAFAPDLKAERDDAGDDAQRAADEQVDGGFLHGKHDPSVIFNHYSTEREESKGEMAAERGLTADEMLEQLLREGLEIAKRLGE